MQIFPKPENLASESALKSHSKAESVCLERKGVFLTRLVALRQDNIEDKGNF